MYNSTINQNLENFTFHDSSEEDGKDPVKLNENLELLKSRDEDVEDPVETLENTCAHCALVTITQNIGQLVEHEDIITSQPCNSSCMDVDDSMQIFIHMSILSHW